MKPKIYVVLQIVAFGLVITTSKVIPTNLVSLIFILTGSTLGFWAMYTMKFKFPIEPSNSKVTKIYQEGPYRYIRHPMYTSLILLGTGFIINEPKIQNVLALVFMIVILQLKSSYEEILLSAKFKEYTDYKDNSKKFIPFLF